MNEIRFVSVQFRNFKALEHFSIRLASLNILIGPNNSGKSTVLSAFRVLESGLRRARAKKAELVRIGDDVRYGYYLSEETVPMSVENVHTDYVEEDATVTFRLSNGSRLILLFPANGGIVFHCETNGRPVTTPSAFRQAFPIGVVSVPVLGPLEHNEEFVQQETVVRELSTHRASRHFRNYWHYFPEGFDTFAKLVSERWPGMTVSPPDPPDYASKTIAMFCRENRMTRELYWAGFGFQVWCQLLTHISRATTSTILVIDEPEIYLHPEVQRQLLEIVRNSGPAVLLATHSAEVVAEAEPSEVLLVQKTDRAARRLTDIDEVQTALEIVGSAHNITLANLARH